MVHVETVMEMTDGKGAEVVIDFVGEKGAQADAWNMTQEAGSHFVVGYGSAVEVQTIDIISTERNIIGNLVGTYNDLAELMVLQAQGRGKLADSYLFLRCHKRRDRRPQQRPYSRRARHPGAGGYRCLNRGVDRIQRKERGKLFWCYAPSPAIMDLSGWNPGRIFREASTVV